MFQVSDRDCWCSDGLEDDGADKASDHVPRLTGVDSSIEERFLLQLEENISLLSQLVEECQEQKYIQNKDVFSASSNNIQELPSPQYSLGMAGILPPSEMVLPMTNYSTAHPSTTICTMMPSTSICSMMPFTSICTMIPSTTTTLAHHTKHKGGKKTLLNSAVKKNLNFLSPKCENNKPVVKTKPYPVLILPRCGAVLSVGKDTAWEEGGN
jgi:hypothetical protein